MVDWVTQLFHEKIGDVVEAMGAKCWCNNFVSQKYILSVAMRMFEYYAVDAVAMRMFEYYAVDAGNPQLTQAALEWKLQPIQFWGPGAEVVPLGDPTVEGGTVQSKGSLERDPAQAKRLMGKNLEAL